jgi:two-component system OmpR family sensor kinase
VVTDAKFEAQSKSVEVLFEISQTLNMSVGPVMNGSPELLRKGIDNVVRNALKFSDAGQHVTVQLETVGTPINRLRIVVSDRGPGVPDQDVQRIFEPFVRLEHPARGAGLGLGLAIARSAAVAHGGFVDAVNRIGGGLTVAFDLPIRPPIEAEQTV